MSTKNTVTKLSKKVASLVSDNTPFTATIASISRDKKYELKITDDLTLLVELGNTINFTANTEFLVGSKLTYSGDGSLKMVDNSEVVVKQKTDKSSTKQTHQGAMYSSPDC